MITAYRLMDFADANRIIPSESVFQALAEQNAVPEHPDLVLKWHSMPLTLWEFDKNNRQEDSLGDYQLVD